MTMAPSSSRGYLAPLQETHEWTRGRPSSSEPTADTIDGAAQIQTPSLAEHGLGGRFDFQYG